MITPIQAFIIVYSFVAGYYYFKLNWDDKLPEDKKDSSILTKKRIRELTEASPKLSKLIYFTNMLLYVLGAWIGHFCFYLTKHLKRRVKKHDKK